MHANMLASYATRNSYILTCIPTQVRLSMHANLLTSYVRNSYLNMFHRYASEITHARKHSG